MTILLFLMKILKYRVSTNGNFLMDLFVVIKKKILIKKCMMSCFTIFNIYSKLFLFILIFITDQRLQ